MNRYSKRVVSLLTVFLTVVATLLLFSIVGCAGLKPLVTDVHKVIHTVEPTLAGSTNSVAVTIK